MSKKQRLLNAVKTLNLTLEQRQELVEAIEDFGSGQSNKTNVLEIEHGHYQDYQHYYVIINGNKLISDTGWDYSWDFEITKENFLKLFNVDSLENLDKYSQLKNIKFNIDNGFYRTLISAISFSLVQTDETTRMGNIGFINSSALITFTENLNTDKITFSINSDA